MKIIKEIERKFILKEKWKLNENPNENKNKKKESNLAWEMIH